uniref:Uncharacterized protein n=1 Tax=Meloidogyne enterolobii TaxID=390850 RepID=A0A6V7XHV9_MELEN|nr:unnamed protein product [Meloidogyne enterolobii]
MENVQTGKGLANTNVYPLPKSDIGQIFKLNIYRILAASVSVYVVDKLNRCELFEYVFVD